jgi:hypothetical protein
MDGEMVGKLFQVESNCLGTVDVYECEGEMPNSAYGDDWVVIRAEDEEDARVAGQAVLFENEPWEDHGVLGHEVAQSCYRY